jgi:hypothetical protein
MILPKSYLAKFWPLFATACRENLPLDADKASKDIYRLKLIMEATGCASLRLVRRDQFERLMQRVAAETEDYDAQMHWSTCDERRYLHLIGAQLNQLGQITGNPCAWSYVRGVLAQAHWPDDWRDISADMMFDVFRMLDTHRRRLLRKHGWCGARSKQPLGFLAARYYFYEGASLLYRDDMPISPQAPDPAI